MHRNKIRYQFEHKLLPRLLFDKKENLIKAILMDESFSYNCLKNLYDYEGIVFPYQEDDFKVEVDYIDHIMSITLFFPEPDEELLCYCVSILFDRSLVNYAYYTMEKGCPILGGNELPCLCSWSEDGTHIHYGTCSLEERQDKCLKIFKGNQRNHADV